MKTNNNTTWCVMLLALFTFSHVTTLNAETTNVLSRSVIIQEEKDFKESKSLAKGYETIKYEDVEYYQSKGRYYTTHEDGYRVVMPPVGVRVSDLPKGYTPLSLLSVEYFCCRGVLYTEIAGGGGYEVISPEVGMTLPELPEAGVRDVLIDGEPYFEAGGFIYKRFSDEEQYVVVCTLESLDA